MTLSYRKQLQSAVRTLNAKFGPPAELAVVFGSGLGEDFLKQIKTRRLLKYSQVPHFASVGVAGHSGEIIQLDSKAIQGRSVIVLKGRIHYYEGYSPERVVFPLRALALWGVKRVLLTNASGSLNPQLKPGDLVWIRDHLNFTGNNPLMGPNLDFLGPRFPSLTQAYENSFSQAILKVAKDLKMVIKPGVYVGISGPSYETEAEISAFRKLGGDLIGMSTVFETIAAVHAGMTVAGLAAVTNSCLHRRFAPNHQEVLANAKRVDSKLSRLLLAFLEK
jgi:purine-nucleoside phosphorylase